MSRTMTYALELLIGLVCAALAIVAWPHRGALRLAAVVFAMAGMAAVAHAVIELAQ